MYFWTYGLRKNWLHKCLKRLLSEEFSTSNMVNEPKCCWNLNDSTFTKFIDHCEGNLVGSYWCAKSLDCLLTRWLQMTSILFLIETIYCNIFRCNYLRKKKFFFLYFVAFWKSKLNFPHFQKKDHLIADRFLIWRTPKNMVR